MYIAYPDSGKPCLFLSSASADHFKENHKGEVFKLRPLKEEEQNNVLAYASLPRKDGDTVLFFDYSKAFLYASRHDSYVEKLVIDLD